MLRTLLVATAFASVVGLAGCGQNSAETAGEKADNAVENATQGHENPGDGAMEQAGSAVDNATGTQRTDNPADAVSDATDGNPSTHP
jgi:hypothetical protein